jgi:hypothetical protein
MGRHYAQLKAALDAGRAAAAERVKQLSVMSSSAMQVGRRACWLCRVHNSWQRWGKLNNVQKRARRSCDFNSVCEPAKLLQLSCIKSTFIMKCCCVMQ